MRYDEGLDLWVRFEEGSMRILPKFLACASVECVLHGNKKASKGTCLRSRVCFWKV